MNLNKHLAYVFGTASLACLLAATPVRADMNLKQALETTAKTNPQILSDMSSAKARENVIRQAEAGYLPKLDASYSAGHERVVNRFRRTTCSSGQKCSAERWRQNPAINLTQNVFDGFQTASNVDRATTDYIQGEKKVDETQEQLLFRAANAYIDVRRFQRMLREAKRNLAAHKEIAGKVKALIKGGRASTADEFTVESRLASAANAVIDIQSDLDTAAAEFKALVGVEADRLVSAKIPDKHLPACLQDAIEEARRYNKSVILARSSVDVALSELNSVESAFYPKLSVEAGTNRAQNNFGEKGHKDTANVLGVVRYNLYNGGADVAKVAETTEKIAQLRYDVDNQLRVAEEEVRKSWAQMVASRENAVQQRKGIVALRKERDAFQKQYEIGTRTLIDVLGSINEYFLSRGALITTDAAEDAAEARLLASMGKLSSRFELARNSPKLYSDKGTDLPNKCEPGDTTCKTEGGNHPNIHMVDEPEKEEVLRTVAAEVAVPARPAEAYMENLATETDSDSSSVAEMGTNFMNTLANVFSSGSESSQETATPAGDANRNDWFYPDYNGKDNVTFAEDNLLAPTAASFDKKNSAEPQAKAAEQPSQEEGASVGDWLSSVFTSDHTENEAQKPAAPTTQQPVKRTSTKEKPVVMGPGLTVPSEIKSGEEIR